MNGVCRLELKSQEMTLLMFPKHWITLACYTIKKEIILKLWSTQNEVCRLKLKSQETTPLISPDH